MSNDAFSFRARCAGPHAVLGFGDSKTSSVPWEQVGTAERLFSWVNCGYGGLTIRGYLDYMRETFPGTDWGQPAGVVIHLGTNNFWVGGDQAEYWSVQPDLTEIVRLAAFIAPRIALVTPPPIEAGYPATVNALARVPVMQAVCDQVRNVAAICAVPLIDLALSPALRRPDGLGVPGTTIDGVHFSHAGQVAAKSMIGQALAAWF